MAELFASGRMVDLILVIVVLEAVGLLIYSKRTRRGIAFGELLPNLLAGVFLLLALRLLLAGAGWMTCCASLAAAGMAHLVDLRQRWRG